MTDQTTEKPFAQIIEEAFARINAFKNGNALFYERFNKSRAVVSSWKSRKVTPSPQDMLMFLSVSNEIIRECQAEKAKVESQQRNLLEEFQTLVSA